MKHLIVAVVVLVAITEIASEEEGSRNVTAAAATSPVKITKREAIVLNSMPMETSLGYKKQAKIIYRRVSRTKVRPYRMHGHGKPHHIPQPHQYGPPKNSRRPPKKHVSKDLKNKYSPPKPRRNHKPKKYRQPSPHKYNRPMHFGAPRVPYKPQEPAGFGEPPNDHFAVKNRNPSFGEPPTDSYGAPLQHSLNYGHAPYKPVSFGQNSYTTPYVHDSQSFPPNYASNEYNSYSPNTQIQPHYSIEPNHAASSHLTHSVGSNYASLNSAYSGSNDDIVKGNGIPAGEYNPNLNRDIYNYDDNQATNYSPKPPYQNHQSEYQTQSGKNKHVVEPTKNLNRPRNGPRGKKHAEEVLVGGQYAEPPARYVPRFQPSAPMHGDMENDSFAPPPNISLDSEESPSTYQSSYINYKNSNMAFSPQNLNDAFSISK